MEKMEEKNETLEAKHLTAEGSGTGKLQPPRHEESSTQPETSTTTTFLEESTSHNDGMEKHVAHDSMVTVRLSEPPNLHINTDNILSSNSMSHARSSSTTESETGDGDETPSAEVMAEESPRITMIDSNGDMVSKSARTSSSSSRHTSNSSGGSAEGEQVDWDELEKSEGQEPKDQWTDDVSVRTPPVWSYPFFVCANSDYYTVHGTIPSTTRTRKQPPCC
jgi:hypothetical protein